MTLVDQRHGALASGPEVSLQAPAAFDPVAGESPAEPPGGGEAPQLPVCVAAFLATAAAGWAVGGIFASVGARATAVLAGLGGAGLVALASGSRRARILQYLAVPLALGAAALVALPTTNAGQGLPDVVASAIGSGALAAPPVPFNAGWRFLVVLLAALCGATSAAAGVSLGRPRLAVAVPVPILVGAMLLQPAGEEALSAVVALGLVLGALGVSFGAHLRGEGALGGRFEVRRLLRAGAMVAVLVAALGLLSQVSSILPQPAQNRSIPPQRPKPPPPPKGDAPLFTVRASAAVPWRTGVLDVYSLSQQAWLTPPFDPARLVTLQGSGAVPHPAAIRGGHMTATFTIRGQRTPGLPDLAGPVRVSGLKVLYDPRTQTISLKGPARPGTTYTVVGLAPPTADQLNSAPPPGRSLAAYLVAPAMPQIVRDVIDAAPPPSKGRYSRLQFVRNKLLAKVVASGTGPPVDVSASNVATMLLGGRATPYEITAAEVLMARWAGIPARIGYGYYTAGAGGGKPVAVRPSDGAMWLEAYFPGYGWVPIVGRPKHAEQSLATKLQNHQPDIVASKNLAVLVYVPLQVQTVTLLYSIAGYWALRVLPWVLGLALLWGFYPGLLKAARARMRRRWARRRGPRARIGAAYGAFRDAAADLGIGHGTDTPIELLDAVAPDKEHRELAWLVTRVIWGDLVRDTRDLDAERAEALARSLTRRMVRAQPALSRIVAVASRTSLREPYCAELPNLWPPGGRAALRGLFQRSAALLARLAGGRRRGATGAALGCLLILAGLVLGGCARQLDLSSAAPANELSHPVVPGELDGLVLRDEPAAAAAFRSLAGDSLVTAGRVYSIRQGTTIQGSLQIAWFKPAVAAQGATASQDLLASLAGGNFTPIRLAGFTVYAKTQPEEQLLVWIPPSSKYYELAVTRSGFDPRQMMAALLAFQQGSRVAQAAVVTTIDPRVGSAY